MSHEQEGRRRLAGIHAKLLRAHEHLQRLTLELDEYFGADPLAVQPDRQPDGETWLLRLKIAPPPIELSVTVGDVLHQLRSAIDHLANGIVVAAGNRPTQRTTFPVRDVRPKGQLTIDGGVTADALDAVDAIQPYQRGDGAASHPLWVLHRLVNVDKHDHLHLMTQLVARTSSFVHIPASDSHGEVLLGGQFQVRVVGDGDVVGVFPVAGGLPDNFEASANGPSYLVLGGDGPWPTEQPVDDLLTQLWEYVANTVVPTFEPFLLPPAH